MKEQLRHDFSKEEDIKRLYRSKKEHLDIDYKTFKRIIEEDPYCNRKETK